MLRRLIATAAVLLAAQSPGAIAASPDILCNAYDAVPAMRALGLDPAETVVLSFASFCEQGRWIITYPRSGNPGELRIIDTRQPRAIAVPVHSSVPAPPPARTRAFIEHDPRLAYLVPMDRFPALQLRLAAALAQLRHCGEAPAEALVAEHWLHVRGGAACSVSVPAQGAPTQIRFSPRLEELDAVLDHPLLAELQGATLLAAAIDNRPGQPSRIRVLTAGTVPTLIAVQPDGPLQRRLLPAADQVNALLQAAEQSQPSGLPLPLPPAALDTFYASCIRPDAAVREALQHHGLPQGANAFFDCEDRS